MGGVDGVNNLSEYSVMTEITVKGDLPPAIERFVLHWGEMGAIWGVNRSVAQTHALLFVSEEPLSAEGIAEHLSLARSNVSTSLRELLAWGLIKREPVLGERRDFYSAESDMFEMVRRIAMGRKARELDPTLDVLRSCVEDASQDKRISKAVQKRLTLMLNFTEHVDKGFDEVIRLPNPTLGALIKMGGRVARVVQRGRGRKARGG